MASNKKRHNGVYHLKQWFPFTDYDFYGYLASGLVAVFCVDYCLNGGDYLLRTHWTFLQGALAISLVYIVGQCIAIPSAIVLENGIASWLLTEPSKILLSDQSSWVERQIGKFLIGRYYRPMPETTRTRLFDRALAEEGLTKRQILAKPELIFDVAYHHARQSEDTRLRIDDFRNQYGLARNVSFVLFLSAYLLFRSDTANRPTLILAEFALILAVAMFIRFLKFYSCFTAAVLKPYAYGERR